jgi:acetylornithine deacetylase
MQFSPDTVTITLAVVGIVPGMTPESVITDIEKLAASLYGSSNNVGFSVRPVEGSLFVEATEPVPVDQEPCVSLSSAYSRLMGGKAPVPNRKNAFNDTIRLREAGINAVTFGPGEDGWSVDNESISITKAVMAARIYALTIMQICKARAA